MIPDIIQEIMIYVNWILGLFVMILSIWNIKYEHRKGFCWMWVSIMFVGLIWAGQYSGDVVHLGFSITDIVDLGISRAINIVTLAVFVGILLQMRIPRNP